MGSPTKSDSSSEFLTIAVQRKLISREQSQDLCGEAARRGIQPSQLAVEKGWLDGVQVDIISALTRPKDVAPGFEILDVLGYGGLGVVYRARQVNLDRVVALKTVLLSRMDRPGVLARFELEAKTVGSLRHPNIVTAFDYGTHHGRLYLAMELIEGEDLDDRLRRFGRLDETLAWAIARQTAAGLAQAAEAGVVHRDIKPANLMLTPAPQGFPLPPGVPMVMITDFGLALLTSGDRDNTRLTVAGTTMGTPQYMAPEQLSEPTVDIRADIYALGATLYHMLAGVPPFAGETTGQILSHKIRGELRDLAEMAPATTPQSLKLVADMMATAPDDRPADYDMLIRRIDALALLPSHEGLRMPARPSHDADTVYDARDETPVPTSRPRGHGRRVRAFLGRLVALLILVGGVGFVVYSLGDERELKELVGEFVPYELLGDAVRFGFLGKQYETGSWHRALLDAATLDENWRVSSGQWSPARDAVGRRVLRGHEGAITRRLPVTTGGPNDRPLTNYRVRSRVDLRDADVVQIHFGVSTTRGESHRRYVLQMARDGVTLGRLDWKSGDFEPVGTKASLPDAPSNKIGANYHELSVGRHGTHWLAHFNGRLIGTLPVRADRESPHIGLVVKGGTAQFAGLSMTELVAP